MKMKKAFLFWLIPLLLALLLAGAYFAVNALYIFPEGTALARSSTEADLRDMELTVQAYTALSEQLPDCRIRWNIPIGGEYYDSFAEEVTLDSLTMEDISLFSYFEELQYIDALQLGCYEALIALQAALPDCRVDWAVQLGSRTFDPTSEMLQLDGTGVTTRQLLDELALFPALKQVELTDTLICADARGEISERYPDICFVWQVQIGNSVFLSTDQQLNLREANAEAEELVNGAQWFYDVQQVDVSGCGYSVEQLLAIREAFDARVDSELELFGVNFTTDAQELDFSGILMEDTVAIEQIIPLMPNLRKVTMCDCGIPSEQMDAMGKRNPQVRFIWTVQIGRAVLRTDVTAFIPCTFGYWPTGGISPYKDAENRLFDEDCKEFRYCIDMICLDLGHMGLTDISFLESMPKLQYLILADNPIEDFTALQYLPELVHLELFMTKFDQADVLAKLKKLETVNLGYTRPTNWQPLTEMTWLEMLWLPGTKLPGDTYLQIVEALPNTIVDYTGEHSTDHGWRNSDNYREMRDLLGMRYLE